MNGQTLLISVIVPVWRAERTLARCVDSLLKQTYQNLEILLVDDGSPDQSGALCDAYAKRDERVRVLHTTNGGVSRARNLGLDAATGALIGFVDSDDWCEPTMYQVLYSQLTQNNADIAICALHQTESEAGMGLGDTNAQPSHTQAKADMYWKDFFRIGTQKCIFYVMNRLYRRAVIDGVRFPEGISDGEDVWFTYRAFCNARNITETSMPLYHYWQNPESLTRSGFSDRDLGLWQVWRDVAEDVRANRPDLAPWAALNLMRVDFTLLCRLILQDDAMTDQRYQAQEQHWRTQLRGNLPQLWRGGIPVSRKLLALGLAFAYTPVKRMMRLAKRCRGWLASKRERRE